MTHNFKFIVCSPYNLEQLTCEIYYKEDDCIGVITQETNEFMLEIYPFSEFKGWVFKLDEFQKALDDAKSLLED